MFIFCFISRHLLIFDMLPRFLQIHERKKPYVSFSISHGKPQMFLIGCNVELSWYKFGDRLWCFISLFCFVFFVILRVLSTVWLRCLSWRLVCFSWAAVQGAGSVFWIKNTGYWWINAWTFALMEMTRARVYLDATFPAEPSI